MSSAAAPLSASDIIASADKQIADLQADSAIIDKKVAAIKDAEWSKPLSPGEIRQINQYHAQQSVILSAIEELSYVTMGALDKSDEITRIVNALKGVVTNLDSHRAEIEDIDQSCKNISAISKNISALVPQIQALAK